MSFWHVLVYLYVLVVVAVAAVACPSPSAGMSPARRATVLSRHAVDQDLPAAALAIGQELCALGEMACHGLGLGGPVPAAHPQKMQVEFPWSRAPSREFVDIMHTHTHTPICMYIIYLRWRLICLNSFQHQDTVNLRFVAAIEDPLVHRTRARRGPMPAMGYCGLSSASSARKAMGSPSCCWYQAPVKGCAAGSAQIPRHSREYIPQPSQTPGFSQGK